MSVPDPAYGLPPLPEQELLREPDRLQQYTAAFLRGDLDSQQYTALTVAELNRRVPLETAAPTATPRPTGRHASTPPAPHDVSETVDVFAGQVLPSSPDPLSDPIGLFEPSARERMDPDFSHPALARTAEMSRYDSAIPPEARPPATPVAQRRSEPLPAAVGFEAPPLRDWGSSDRSAYSGDVAQALARSRPLAEAFVRGELSGAEFLSRIRGM